MKQINLFLALMALLVITSCTDDNKPTSTTIKLSQTEIELRTADTISITATVSPTTLTDELVWTSSNKEVATINSNGFITAISSGEATISATIGNSSAICNVDVTASLYAVGTINDSNNAPLGILWRDSIIIDTITDSSEYGYLQGVALDSNNNIYIAGYSSTSNGMSAPFYWKDGVSTTLESIGSYGYPTSLSIFNNNVYISGVLNSGQENIATIWENGTSSTLTDGVEKAYASALFVTADTTYVVGYTNPTSSEQTAVIWRNGVATNLSDGTSSAAALDITISDGDIYIGGYDGDNAVIWKNGVKEVVSNSVNGAKILAICSSASGDIYACGYILNSNYAQMATIWKNGVSEQLYNTAAVASDIYIDGDDLYIAGEVYGVSTPASTAAIWINGEYIPYSDGKTNSNISAIFVK